MLTRQDLSGICCSILFTTGYLTQCEIDDNGVTALVIPNKEIQWIFEEQIRDWSGK